MYFEGDGRDHAEEEEFSMLQEEEEEEDSHADHGEEDNHAAAAKKFGLALFSGYLPPFLLASIFPAPHEPEDQCEACHIRLEDESRHAAATAKKRREEEEETLLEEGQVASSGDVCEGCRETASEDGCTYQPPKEKTESDESTLKDDNRKKMIPILPLLASGEGKVTFSDEADNVIVDRLFMANIMPDAPASTSKKLTVDWGLSISILLGDAFHNFTDGIFVGDAFFFCERSVGFAIVAATLYHEFAPEVADFCLLTQHCCHIKT